jgi:hypothetical protein
VHLKGLARCRDDPIGGSCSPDSRSIFFLPLGYRPPHWTFFPTLAGGNNLHYVTIYTGGLVQSDAGDSAFDYILLDGLSFRCGPSRSNGCP